MSEICLTLIIWIGFGYTDLFQNEVMPLLHGTLQLLTFNLAPASFYELSTSTDYFWTDILNVASQLTSSGAPRIIKITISSTEVRLLWCFSESDGILLCMMSHKYPWLTDTCWSRFPTGTPNLAQVRSESICSSGSGSSLLHFTKHCVYFTYQLPTPPHHLSHTAFLSSLFTVTGPCTVCIQSKTEGTPCPKQSW